MSLPHARGSNFADRVASNISVATANSNMSMEDPSIPGDRVSRNGLPTGGIRQACVAVVGVSLADSKRRMLGLRVVLVQNFFSELRQVVSDWSLRARA